jgi:hypothetical protein
MIMFVDLPHLGYVYVWVVSSQALLRQLNGCAELDGACKDQAGWHTRRLLLLLLLLL